MNRRSLRKAAALVPAAYIGARSAPLLAEQRSASPSARVRPRDANWPDEASWAELNRDVGGRLVKLASPLDACRRQPDGAAWREVVRELQNPYYIGHDPALTQTTGWIDAWSAEPSVYSVAAHANGDVVAAVNFARVHNLKLVVRGGGHSYLGTSCASDSLQIRTRKMN